MELFRLGSHPASSTALAGRGPQEKRRRSFRPYDHLASVHGRETFELGRRGSGWADYILFQTWDEGGAFNFMLDKRRRLAWEMSMAYSRA